MFHFIPLTESQINPSFLKLLLIRYLVRARPNLLSGVYFVWGNSSLEVPKSGRKSLQIQNPLPTTQPSLNSNPSCTRSRGVPHSLPLVFLNANFTLSVYFILFLKVLGMKWLGKMRQFKIIVFCIIWLLKRMI